VLVNGRDCLLLVQEYWLPLLSDVGPPIPILDLIFREFAWILFKRSISTPCHEFYIYRAAIKQRLTLITPHRRTLKYPLRTCRGSSQPKIPCPPVNRTVSFTSYTSMFFQKTWIVATLASSPVLTWSFFRLSKGYEC
jgi:hypothetical protein